MQQRRRLINNRHKSTFQLVFLRLEKKERGSEHSAVEAIDCLQYYISLLMCDVTWLKTVC